MLIVGVRLLNIYIHKDIYNATFDQKDKKHYIKTEEKRQEP